MAVAPATAPAERGRVLTRIEIRGMDCGECAKTVEHSLAVMPGVSEAKVSFAAGTADVRHDLSTTSVPALSDRIRSLGYRVEPVGAPDRVWVFDIGGMDCANCVRTVEAGVRRLPGIETAVASLAAGTLTVTTANASAEQDRVAAAVGEAGFVVRYRDAAAPIVTAPQIWRQRRLVEC